MNIFISPDRTKYPDDFEVIPCAKLESLTGADMCITEFPLPVNESTLQSHIDSRALFVQIKIGHDAIGDFNQIWREIARMQTCKIPIQQAIILTVGIYKPSSNGLLSIQGNQTPSNYEKITYKTYLKNVAEWRYSGVSVCNINDINELNTWIEAQVEELERIKSRDNKKQVYPQSIKPVFEIDDIWQLVEEVPPNSMAYLLCAGLYGFGEGLWQATMEYFENELPHLPPTGHYVLSVLTEMKDGKQVHTGIKGYGKGKWKFLRDLLLLPDNVNLSLNGNITRNDQLVGWNAALSHLKQLVDNGHSVKDAFNACVKLPAHIEIDF